MKNYITLDELVIQHENIMKNTLKLASLTAYKRRYIQYIQPYFGTSAISSINLDRLLQWWSDMTSLKSRNNKNYSTNTLNCSIRGTFNAYMNFAVNMVYIAQNPLSLIPQYKNPNEVHMNKNNYWTSNEFNNFLSTVDNLLYYSLFYILFFTGMRIGEVLSLQWNDIDFSRNKLYINKTLRYISKQKGYIISPPKSWRSQRCIELTDGCINLLDELFCTYETYPNFKMSNFVFGNSCFLKYPTIRVNFMKYISKSHVKSITIHGLRHSHASMLINANVPDYLIADHLGHSVNELYKTYAHIYISSKEEFFPILNHLECEFQNIKS